MKSTGSFSFILTIIFAFSTVSVAYSADDRAVQKRSTTPAATGIASPLAPAAGSTPSSQSGPGNLSGSCCESPSPFPGLYCCDTRDCGWFDCDALRLPGKRFLNTR